MQYFVFISLLYIIDITFLLEFIIFQNLQLMNLTTLSEPALFINTLKYDINLKIFCRILSNKEIWTREGNYDTTDERKDRIFKK